MDLCIVVVHELLNGLKGGIVQLFGHLRVDLLNLLQVVYSDVLVSVGLKDVTSDFPSFKARGVDEVAILAACAAIGSVIIAAGHRAEITWLDKLVLLYDGLLGCHLADLSHLDSSLLVYFFVLDDLLVGERDKDLRCLARRLLKQATDLLFLLYITVKREC